MDTDKSTNELLINVLNGKKIYSIESNESVAFVNDVYDETLSKNMVYSDGTNNGAFDDFETFLKNVKELIADRDNYEDL